MSEAPWDVVVLGELLVEFSTPTGFVVGDPARFGVSGDALNVAAAAAATGARVALATVVPDDELGDVIAETIRSLGVSDALVRRRPGQQGVYMVHSDPNGEREFFYARSGSVGSSLSPADLDPDALASAGAVVTGGIAAAISASAWEAVRFAASTSRRFVYDPNFRPRLTTAELAGARLRELAAQAFLVTPSFPGETSALLGVDTALAAAAVLRDLGAANVAVTCGASGVQAVGADGSWWIDAIPAPAVVDQTGAGDTFVGTTVARLVAGDDLPTAVSYGAAAASLAVGGAGGSSSIPRWADTVAHLGARE